MKYKAPAGDWTMTYDSDAKVLTMKRIDKGKGYLDSSTVKGNFDLSEFRHKPTAGIGAELAVYWLAEFKPCENRDGEYNPFAKNSTVKDLVIIGNALVDIYTK